MALARRPAEKALHGATLVAADALQAQSSALEGRAALRPPAQALEKPRKTGGAEEPAHALGIRPAFTPGLRKFDGHE
jgi:hypothetical protein